jgi:hypothetical protein
MSRFYRHLNLDERRTIFQLLQLWRTASEIATSHRRPPQSHPAQMSQLPNAA